MCNLSIYKSGENMRSFTSTPPTCIHNRVLISERESNKHKYDKTVVYQKCKGTCYVIRLTDEKYSIDNYKRHCWL
jgi:hypothetical protein